MKVKLLGTAAGGGFPQWNCHCSNCLRVRQGRFSGKPRTQSQVALTSNDKQWYLINASPDLRAQIESTPELHPSRDQRHTPIHSVFLTNGDLDHVLGLLLMRESQHLNIYATQSIQQILMDHNTMFAMLTQTPNQVDWIRMQDGVAFELSRLQITPLGLQGRYPRYVQARGPSGLPPGDAVLGLEIKNLDTGKILLHLPGVATLDEKLMTRLNSCDLLLFDGTFWSEDELRAVQPGAKSATEMGHIPLSGPAGILERLKGLTKPRKIFVHINNTNPILDKDSPVQEIVRRAGWEVGEDGMEFIL